MCIQNGYYDSLANQYLNLIKNNSIYCAAKIIQVAAMAQKAMDSMKETTRRQINEKTVLCRLR